MTYETEVLHGLELAALSCRILIGHVVTFSLDRINTRGLNWLGRNFSLAGCGVDLFEQVPGLTLQGPAHDTV